MASGLIRLPKTVSAKVSSCLCLRSLKGRLWEQTNRQKCSIQFVPRRSLSHFLSLLSTSHRHKLVQRVLKIWVTALGDGKLQGREESIGAHRKSSGVWLNVWNERGNYYPACDVCSIQVGEKWLKWSVAVCPCEAHYHTALTVISGVSVFAEMSHNPTSCR